MPFLLPLGFESGLEMQLHPLRELHAPPARRRLTLRVQTLAGAEVEKLVVPGRSQRAAIADLPVLGFLDVASRLGIAICAGAEQRLAQLAKLAGLGGGLGAVFLGWMGV